MTTKKKQAWEKMKASNVTAVLSVLFTFLLLGGLFFIQIPEGNKEIFTSIISFVMGTLLSGVVYYLFGYQSKNNKEKDDLDTDYLDYCKHCNRSFSTQLPGEDTTSEEEEEEPVN